MQRAHLARCLSLVLLATTPTCLLGADMGAMLYPAGKVLVNGMAASRNAAVLPGDKIETGNNARATLTASGTSVQLVSASAATFTPQELSVARGAATVNTSGSMKARVRNLRIEAASSHARFNVGERDHKVYIAALDGRIRINDGKQQMMLDGGHALAIPVSDANGSAADQTAGQSGQSGGAGGSVPTGGVSLGKATSIGLAFAGAALGIGLAVGLSETLSPDPASPAK